MTLPPGHSIETLGPEYVAQAVEMAAAEGWNPGLADAVTFHDADPHAFTGVVAEGRVIACISIARYGAEYGFLGFYICAPEWRGRGIGLALWNAALERVGPIAIALDGVVAQQENYARSGFAYRHANLRHGGVPMALADTGEGAVHPIDACDPVALARYDAAVFGIARPDFFRVWLAQPGATAYCAMRDGQVTGYGLCRPCREGAKIGPLFADDAATARTVFTALVRDVSGPVFLDTPAPNAAAIALARDAGLAPVFETARMVRGTAPVPDLARTFGITSFEFG